MSQQECVCPVISLFISTAYKRGEMVTSYYATSNHSKWSGAFLMQNMNGSFASYTAQLAYTIKLILPHVQHGGKIVLCADLRSFIEDLEQPEKLTMSEMAALMRLRAILHTKDVRLLPKYASVFSDTSKSAMTLLKLMRKSEDLINNKNMTPVSL